MYIMYVLQYITNKHRNHLLSIYLISHETNLQLEQQFQLDFPLMG